MEYDGSFEAGERGYMKDLKFIYLDDDYNSISVAKGNFMHDLYITRGKN